MIIYAVVEDMIYEGKHHLGYYQKLEDAESALKVEAQTFNESFPYGDSTLHYIKEVEVK